MEEDIKILKDGDDYDAGDASFAFLIGNTPLTPDQINRFNKGEKGTSIEEQKLFEQALKQLELYDDEPDTENEDDNQVASTTIAPSSVPQTVVQTGVTQINPSPTQVTSVASTSVAVSAPQTVVQTGVSQINPSPTQVASTTVATSVPQTVAASVPQSVVQTGVTQINPSVPECVTKYLDSNNLKLVNK